MNKIIHFQMTAKVVFIKPLVPQEGIIDLVEIDTLFRLSHPFVLHGEEVLISSLILILPRAQMDLLSFYQNRETTVSDLKTIFWQIAEAMSFIHDSGVIHCDLKPANILIKTASPIHVLIADFGISVYDDSSNTVTLSSQNKKYSASYRPPESFGQRDESGQMEYLISQKGDVWGYACLLGEVIQKRPLFGNLGSKGVEEVITEILDEHKEEFLEGIISHLNPNNLEDDEILDFQEDVYELLSLILIFEEGQRPSFHQIAKKPVFDSARVDVEGYRKVAPLPDDISIAKRNLDIKLLLDNIGSHLSEEPLWLLYVIVDLFWRIGSIETALYMGLKITGLFSNTTLASFKQDPQTLIDEQRLIEQSKGIIVNLTPYHQAYTLEQLLENKEWFFTYQEWPLFTTEKGRSKEVTIGFFLGLI